MAKRKTIRDPKSVADHLRAIREIDVIAAALKEANALKLLVRQMEKDADKKDVLVVRTYATLIRRISVFIKHAGATRDVVLHLQTLASLLTDHANGVRVPLFVLKSKAGRSRDQSRIWALRAQAALCVWLLEPNEGSDIAAALLVTRKCPMVAELKRNQKNSSMPKLLSKWRREFEAGEGNEGAARLFGKRKAFYQKDGLLSAEDSYEEGIKLIGTLSHNLTLLGPALGGGATKPSTTSVVVTSAVRDAN